MKVCVFVLLFVFCYVECRKTYVPIDKTANVAFINMESGGVRPPPAAKPAAPAPSPAKPVVASVPTPAPNAATTAKPVAPTVKQAPAAVPVNPKTPTQITPKPMYPAPVAKPVTTPGPSSVKQLITFYDSQGKASPIRPYSYSQAVKQG